MFCFCKSAHGRSCLISSRSCESPANSQHSKHSKSISAPLFQGFTPVHALCKWGELFGCSQSSTGREKNTRFAGHLVCVYGDSRQVNRYTRRKKTYSRHHTSSFFLPAQCFVFAFTFICLRCYVSSCFYGTYMCTCWGNAKKQFKQVLYLENTVSATTSKITIIAFNQGIISMQHQEIWAK